MTPVEFAFTEYFGEKEVKGQKDNPAILDLFNHLGYPGNKLKDETAWCAAFVNYCLSKTGHNHSAKLNARSLLDVGEDVIDPMFGDIVVLWRESPQSWKGHVGFFIRERRGWIYVLGGNQNNEVNITAYSKNRLLGYRRPMINWIT